MKQENTELEQSLAKKYTSRNIKDLITKIIVFTGGGSVLVALGLIFVYLGIEVVPLFQGIESEVQITNKTQTNNLLHLSIEEQNKVALSIDSSGVIRFTEMETGKIISEELISSNKISKIYTLKGASNIYILAAFENGMAKLLRPKYQIKYLEKKQNIIIPSITYPLGEDLIELHGDGSLITNITFELDEDNITIVSSSTDNLFVTKFSREESFLDDEVNWEKEQLSAAHTISPDYIFIDQAQNNILLLDKSGSFLRADNELKTIETGDFIEQEEFVVSAAAGLSAGSSILIADTSGTVTQWFPVRNKSNNFEYIKIRDFDLGGSDIKAIVPEYSRKIAYIYDSKNLVSIIHTTSQQIIHQEKLIEAEIKNLAISPRANAVLINTEDSISLFHIDNEHPEVSFSSLWEKVWYEGYEQPEYIWQSSSSSNDFESKFSFIPLAFGTLKAAFYAMLFATPIGVLAGAYTAYFMKPKLRQVVKPTVELMAALPTVILGFLAGLWLAPFIEYNLPGIFCLPIVVPLGIIALSLFWTLIPNRFRQIVPDGSEILLLMPVIIFLIWLSFYLSPMLEIALFGGNTRSWLTDTMGINFDQRNSIIIGITMGIAVIPNIFSITEDAIYGVPRTLTDGSLALGATQWQTMTKVIILTASPAIFSAIMIGMGRAIGETMIVLMATGNTPIMDFNIFEGMRTLAANIAVEMPEAEVGSTHFRLLFLSAFTLFILTFIFNTLSEIISTRLRNKYSNL